MKPVKCVVVDERLCHDITLEEITKGVVKLDEIKGKIIFSETIPTYYGSCLSLKIENCKQSIWWQEQSKMPMNIYIGQTLRGFYDGISSSERVIVLKAYELGNNGEVFSRGRSSSAYEFIEEEKNAA